MANIVQELLIRIGVKSDVSGADKAAASIANVDKSAKGIGTNMGKAATSSKELAGALGKNVEVGSQAVSMMTSLEGASKGGAAGLASAARAGLAFVTMLKGAIAGAGPIGVAVTILAALAGGAFALAKAFEAPKESVDEFKARLAALDKATLKNIEATIGLLSERLNQAKADADAVRQSLDMIDDAEMGATLAANKASGLDDKEKARQEILIRDEFKRRKQLREQEAAELARDQAKEKRDALAPEFEDARRLLGDIGNERDRIRTLERERDQLKREQAGRAGFDFDYVKAERIRAIDRSIPQGDDRAKLEAEYESARKQFQGDDGKSGIAAQYQAAAAEAEKADAALKRLLDTRQKVADWEKAQLRIENGGIDPRDAEAAARKSPGRARIIGPDGLMREYDVTAQQTANQGISAAAAAAKAGPLAQQANTIQQNGGSLPGDGQAANGITQPLKDTADAMRNADTGEDAAKAAEEVKQATEQQVQAQTESAAAQQAAFEQTASFAREITAVTSQNVSTINRHTSEIAQLRAQVANMRTRAA